MTMNRKFVNLQTVLNPQAIRALTKRKASKGNANGTPQFPGQASGLTIEEVRELISMQPRQKGFTFQVAANDNVLDNIKLPGDSRILLGINWSALQATSATDTYSLTVNNNKIVEDVPVLLNSTQTGSNGIDYSKEPYIPLMQPLSGSDDLEINYVAGAPGSIQMVLWYV